MMDAIRTRLLQRWALSKDEATWCGLVLDIDEQSAMVVVKATSKTRAIVAAQVCPVRSIDPSIALQYNSIAARGALAIELGSTYVLREIIDVGDGFEGAIEELAREAVRLRTNVKRHTTSAQAVSHFAD